LEPAGISAACEARNNAGRRHPSSDERGARTVNKIGGSPATSGGRGLPTGVFRDVEELITAIP